MKKNKPFLILICLLQVSCAFHAFALNKPVLLAPGNGSTGYVRNPGFHGQQLRVLIVMIFSWPQIPVLPR